MDTIYSSEAIKYALSLIKDGNIFEQFSQDLLAKVLGYTFIPAGGIRDRGIDGLEHTFSREGLERTVYQSSIERDYKAKIKDTIETLRKNKIRVNQLVYVSNQQIPKKDVLQDELVQKYKIPINIYDLDWLALHINDSDQTIRSFNIFVDSQLHEFNRPGKSYTVTNLELDPRVYIYLRQQVEERQDDLKLDEILVDTLILYSLEDTDPDRGILLKRDEILERVRQLVKFDPSVLSKLIDARLGALSSKPRRINHHREDDAYCLRYEERIHTQNRNLSDVALQEAFLSDTRVMIEAYKPSDKTFQDFLLPLIFDLVHLLFYRQGIEFADFVLHEEITATFEKSLPELVSEIVDRGKYTGVNAQELKIALLTTIRNIVYDGTKNQKEFLTRLSRTYVMLLLLQCDPQLSTYFSSLANKLRIYVGTSIIIPALSEIYIEKESRRYTNLLLGARNTGVQLIINEAILSELVAHFRMIKRIFTEDYKGREEVFTDDLSVIYIREIMIRAFFYSRLRGQVDTFNNFLGRFISPSLKNIQDDLVQLLKGEFGIDYIQNDSFGIHLDSDEVTKIENELRKYKVDKTSFGSLMKAHNDAQVMLTIHALRERNNELGSTGVFGYHTWWLSSDVTTQKAAVAASGKKYIRTCYMRPDFLYNYVSFAPTKGAVEESFRNVFPTLLGVSLSWELPDGVVKEIHEFLSEHRDQPPSRIKAAIREAIDNLKQKPDKITSDFIRDNLESHLKE